MEEVKLYADLVNAEFQKVSNEQFATFYTNWPYSFFYKLKEKKAKKNRLKFENVIEIPHSKIPVILFDSKSLDDAKKSKGKKSKPSEVIYDRTGMYRFEFDYNGKKEYIVFCCFLNQINEQMNVYASTISTLEKIKQILKEEKKKQNKPQLGIFTGSVDDNNVLHYIRFEEQMSKKVIQHHVKQEIIDDIAHFYANIDQTIKNKEKGTRKILIAGNQGTGKSSFINELLLNYKGTHSILFCTDLKQLVRHQELCSKYDVACISVLEDCEGFLDDRNSNLLNYLSGSLEYANKKGAYTIMTTNYPHALSDRIKHRPERIDDVFILSNLNEKDALAVAEIYFSQFLPKDFDYKTLKGVFTDCTGAEVMKYAQDVKKHANFQLGGFEKIDMKFIKKIMEEQRNKYKKLDKINTGKTSLAKAGNGFAEEIGFGFGKKYDDNDY